MGADIIWANDSFAWSTSTAPLLWCPQGIPQNHLVVKLALVILPIPYDRSAYKCNAGISEKGWNIRRVINCITWLLFRPLFLCTFCLYQKGPWMEKIKQNHIYWRIKKQFTLICRSRHYFYKPPESQLQFHFSSKKYHPTPSKKYPTQTSLDVMLLIHL